MTPYHVTTLLLTAVLLGAQAQTAVQYPTAKKVDQVDDYFGTKVADPYRWLEDLDSAETKAWVEAQNKLTFGYLERIPERQSIKERLTKLWNYERYGAPSKQGEYYVFSKNDGLQNQSVLYKTKQLDAAPEVLLDPNGFSSDGTVALSGVAFSDDGRLMAYATSTSGSDWKRWQIRQVGASTDLRDHIEWSKFSSAAWLKDSSGFYYSRYDAPKAGEALKGVNKNQKLFLHRVGSRQEDDRLVYERPDKPDWGLTADVTDDGRFLVIYQTEGTEPKNRIFLQQLRNADDAIKPFLDQFDAEYTIVGNDGDRFYVQTDKDAPRGRLVAIDRTRPKTTDWKVLIPEGPEKHVLADVTMINNQFVVTWRTDAHDRIQIYDRSGAALNQVELPTIGTVGVGGRRKDK